MVGILLAAGFSRRFGVADKLLQILPDGRQVALAAAQNLVKAVPVSVAVVRPGNKILAELLLQAGLEVVFCDADQQQMADSLSAAIRFSSQLEATQHGFVIALADMPYIQPETISAVADKLSARGSIVVPTYNGQRGHPVAFSGKFTEQLKNLHGDEGARSIIMHHSSEVELLPCQDPGVLQDIDTLRDIKNN